MTNLFVFLIPSGRIRLSWRFEVYFDAIIIIAVILGLNYFGSWKRGALTLAWEQLPNGYVAPRGLKIFKQNTVKGLCLHLSLVVGFQENPIDACQTWPNMISRFLHDDAFIISVRMAPLLPSDRLTSDKTNDYPYRSWWAGFLCHRCRILWVTLDENGKSWWLRTSVTGNGRTVKSHVLRLQIAWAVVTSGAIFSYERWFSAASG